MSRYTNEELLEGIGRAIKARDFEAVEVMLRALAVQAPHDAQAVLDTLAIAKALR